MGSARRLVIASRGSKLALRQAAIVSDLVRLTDPSVVVEIRTIRTTGDRDARPYRAIGGKGLFVAEVEREVAERRADVAVHSAKDLTAALGPGCAIVCVPARGPVHDVIVGGFGDTGEQRLASLPAEAVVGTSSMRRKALVAEARPDLEVAELRGNLDTRLRKVAQGEVDVAVLAAAGVERLGLTDEVKAAPLDPDQWVPPPGQGALAIEARSDREDLAAFFAAIEDQRARAEVDCERSFAARMEGGCSVPLGCIARASETQLVVTAFLGDPDGTRAIRDRISGGLDAPEDLGGELAEAILSAGGDELLGDLRALQAPAVELP